MSVASLRARRALSALLAASPALWSGPAFAVDKEACVAAAEAGQRLRKQGQLVEAREQLVVCASLDCPAVVSQDCTGWLGEVQRSLTSFVVRARDAHGVALREVTVVLDGKPLPETAPTANIEVDPGAHVVRCELAGFAPYEQHVELAEGERGREIDCELVALHPAVVPHVLQPAPASVAPPSGVPWGIWPLAGLGAVGIAGFAVFGLEGRNQERALTCGPYCTQAEVDPVQTKFTVANVSLLVGVVALGAVAVALILHSSASAPRPAGAYVSTTQGRPPQLPLALQPDAPQLSEQH